MKYVHRYFSIALIVLISQPCVALLSRKDIDSNRELLILDRSVTDSPDAVGAGAIGFASIFALTFEPTVGAGGNNDLRLRQWLDEWKKSALSLGIPIQPRQTQSLEWIWPKDSSGHLDLAKAPFRLNAIVYRPDLREEEVRFVYNLVNPITRMSEAFSVIFEFTLVPPVTGPTWAESFHSLRVSQGPDFLQNILAIRARLVSSRAIIRTNDFFLASEWDLRQFEVESDGVLRAQPLNQTPDSKFRSSASLANWVSLNSGDVLAGRAVLPSVFQTGNASVQTEAFRWLEGQGLDPNLRERFSMQTCSGCHSGETLTRFTHISPRALGLAAVPSNFLIDDIEFRKDILAARLNGEIPVAAKLIKRRFRRTH